jgi:hypothetical protein
LNKAEHLTLIEYVKTSIEILMNIKVEEYQNNIRLGSQKPPGGESSLSSSSEYQDPPKDYE